MALILGAYHWGLALSLTLLIRVKGPEHVLRSSALLLDVNLKSLLLSLVRGQRDVGPIPLFNVLFGMLLVEELLIPFLHMVVILEQVQRILVLLIDFFESDRAGGELGEPRVFLNVLHECGSVLYVLLLVLVVDVLHPLEPGLVEEHFIIELVRLYFIELVLLALHEGIVVEG